MLPLLLLLFLSISSSFQLVSSFVSLPTPPLPPVHVRQSSCCCGGWSTWSTVLFQENQQSQDEKKKTVVIIGGGWAGYTAAEELSRNAGDKLDIKLLDANASAGGLAGGFRTLKGRPVDAGIHGFWREYRNTFQVMEGIDGVELDEVLTDYIPSILVSKSGRVAVAPVVGESKEDWNEKRDNLLRNSKGDGVNSLLSSVASVLPPPLDLALLADVSPSSPLSPIDRASGVGLLAAWADFEQEGRESWIRYDSYSADDLFKRFAGVSPTLYEEFISPLLHVLPMAPGYDCSAAAALSCFHVFALQSKGAFDVRWGRGSLSEKIFEPWMVQLRKRGVEILGGCRVRSIDKDDKRKIVIETDGSDEVMNCDAIVLAIGAVSCSKLTNQSKFLRDMETTRDFNELRGVTCVAVRLFLKGDKITTGLHHGSRTRLAKEIAVAMKESPVVVCGAAIGGLTDLAETGFCIYDLQRMHDEFDVDRVDENISVLEVDFFRANSFVNKTDDEIIDLALQAVSLGLNVRPVDLSLVLDSAVLRARNAVSHFTVGSASTSPNIKLGDGAYICGDWVDRTGHASWSTEKSVVTAKQASIQLLDDLGITSGSIEVIPAAQDTPQLESLRAISRFLRANLPNTINDGKIPPSPWKLMERLLS